MKRIFVPTRTGAEWQHLLAKPSHWQKGASAMTAAAAWEAAADKLPPEVASLLESTKSPELVGQRLLIALPEWQVALPGGSTASCTDIMALCRNELGLCVVGVEAKVLEDFGPPLVEKRTEASSGQGERLTYLHILLGVERFNDNIRYQLLHRTASALLTAREFHANTAVMLVHAFDTPAVQRADFLDFASVMGANEIAPLVYCVPSFAKPSLYLAWCTGDPKFRESQLPNAL
jgi:hypothetical protein